MCGPITFGEGHEYIALPKDVGRSVSKESSGSTGASSSGEVSRSVSKESSGSTGASSAGESPFFSETRSTIDGYDPTITHSLANMAFAERLGGGDMGQRPSEDTSLDSFSQQNSEPKAFFEQEMSEESSKAEGVKQRKMVKLFPRGCLVEIYSASKQRWIVDGEVVEVAWESIKKDKVLITAGSTKVVFDQGRLFKWVPSHKLHETVRRSSRPQRPKPLVGQIMLERPAWLGANVMQWSYFQLRSGVMQWWETEQDAAAGKQPDGKVKLLGMKMKREGMCISLRIDNTCGESCSLKAQLTESPGKFVSAVRAHAKFCDQDQKFFETQVSSEQSGSVVQ